MGELDTNVGIAPRAFSRSRHVPKSAFLFLERVLPLVALLLTTLVVISVEERSLFAIYCATWMALNIAMSKASARFSKEFLLPMELAKVVVNVGLITLVTSIHGSTNYFWTLYLLPSFRLFVVSREGFGNVLAVLVFGCSATIAAWWAGDPLSVALTPLLFLPCPIILSAVILTFLRDHIELLQKVEHRYERLTDASPVGVLELNLDGFCSYANEQWDEITGRMNEESLGHGWQSILSADAVTNVLALSSGRRGGFEVEISRPGGHRWILFQGTGDGDEEALTVVTATDITERKEAAAQITRLLNSDLRRSEQELRETNQKLEAKNQLLVRRNEEVVVKKRALEVVRKELEERAQQLEEADRYKSEFMANMSHELRTPLNSMLILSQLLAANREQNLTPRQAESASAIYSAGKDLLCLINDVLDLAKIEAGHMDVTLGSVDTFALFHEIKALFDPVSQRSGIAFEIELDETLPETLISDRRKLSQILKNFLSNAFKFTSHGTVTLRAFVPAHERGKSVVCIQVTDTGIGIAEDKHDVVFQAFKQSDGTTSRRYGGTGLGLSISRELAELLGATIELESSEGDGSTFSLRLPVKRLPANASASLSVAGLALFAAGATHTQSVISEEPKQRAVDPRMNPSLHDGTFPAPSLSGRKILVVDDDMRNVFALTQLLSAWGASVQLADNGQLALDKLDADPNFDIVLMDVMMPVMDGHETTRRIRERNDFTELPIIAVTAKAMPGDRDECIDAGMSDYLSKPIDARCLARVLHTWLEKGPRNPQPSKSSSLALAAAHTLVEF